MKKATSKIIISSFIFLLFFGLLNLAKAQNATDVLRYSLQYPSYDPVTMVVPGVAYATGFGAYQENPAVMALFDESYFSGGLNDLYVTEQGTYLSNTNTFDVNSLGLSHAGFVYKAPTSRGSLVVGAGYSLTRGFNRALSGSGFNEITTLTDYYASFPITHPLNEAAFSAFAIDDVELQNGNVVSRSIFRLPLGFEYQGITQSFELTETGTMGEYSAFIATELFKNLSVGASIGAIAGTYEYERSFLESDVRNLYDDNFIDSDGDGDFDTDIGRILSESAIKETYTGFSARLGVLYEISNSFNIGASYQFKNVLTIERETDFAITTILDNNLEFFGEISPTVYNYKVVRPARANLGIAATDIGGFTLSAMVERVDYSSASIEFEELTFSIDEQAINQRIENELQEVFNLRFGLEYVFTDRLTTRFGYGFYPSPVEDKDSDRQFFSGGFSAMLSGNTSLNVGVQYATWEDQTILYTTPFGDEVVDEQVNRWNIMAGLRFYF